MIDIEDAVLQPRITVAEKSVPRLSVCEVTHPKTPIPLYQQQNPLAKKVRNGVTA
jgi:hypothetical protein